MRPSRLSVLIGVLALAIAGCEGDGAPLSPGADDDPKAGLEGSESIAEQQVEPPSDAPPIWTDDLGTGLNQSDDDCDFVELGFTFYFYGQAYTGIWVNSNGTLSFVDCNYYYSAAIPEDPKIFIAPLYGDFNPSVNGDVYYNVLGSPGSRTFVATWYDVPEYSPSSGTNSTFQVQLHEGSNTIVFGYNTLNTDGINWTTGPDGDTDMEVGLTSGTGAFVRSVEGTDIPALQGTNLCYSPSGGDYSELGCAADVDGAVVVGFRGVMAPEEGRVNIASSGLLATAVLNTSLAANDPFEFDPASLTASSLVLGPDRAPTAHDLSDAATRELHRADVDGDGDLDLVLHVRGDRTGLRLGDNLLCFRGATAEGEDVAGCSGVETYYEPAGPPPYETPIRGALYDLSFELGAADCEGSSSWEVHVNGQVVATEPVTGACACGAEPQILGVSNSAARAAWNAYGSNTISVVPVGATAGNDIAIGYVSVFISTERDGVARPLFDALGGSAQARDLCLGFAWDEADPVISFTTR